MSTGKTNIQAQRFASLARLGENIFHASDVASLWSISEKNTLYTTLRRYTKAGLLHRIYKGLYALVPLAQLDPRMLALKTLHEYAYLTTESVLYAHGYLSQKPGTISLVSSHSKRISIGKILVRSRRLAPQFLMNPTGVTVIDGIRTASAERAIADMLYFRPTFYFDKPVAWSAVKKIQMQIGYPLTPSRYDTAAT